MANATISIPGGINVQLEGTPDEIFAVVENIRIKQAESPSHKVPASAQGRGESHA